MEKKLYRVWYRLYLFDEEDFFECEAESVEDARRLFHECLDNYITYIEEADYPL